MTSKFKSAGLATILAVGVWFLAEQSANSQPPVLRAEFSGLTKEGDKSPKNTTLTVTFDQKLTILWDGSSIVPEQFKDVGQGLMTWRGKVSRNGATHWYVVRMGVRGDAFDKLNLEYDVFDRQGGQFLYHGSAELTGRIVQ